MPSSSHARRAARVVAVTSALFWAVPFFGVVDLAVPVLETPGFYEAYLLETGWGVLYTFLVAVPLLVVSIAPRSRTPLVGLGVVATCLAVTAAAAGSWPQLAPAAALAVTCGLLSILSPARAASARPARRAGLDPAVAALAVVLVPWAVTFAWDMVRGFREGRPPTDDDTWGIDHWPTQAAAALALAVLALTVATGVRQRWSGTAASAVVVGVAAAWLGFWSATYPDHAGSAGRAAGTGLVVWACTFGAVTCWRLRAARATIAPDSRAEVPG